MSHSALFPLLMMCSCATPVSFLEARPVWLADRETEMNVFAGFRAFFQHPGDAATLRIAGATLYRAFVNGAFVGHGPARGPHGHYRVDEWNIAPFLRSGVNVVAVEVAGYNANSYYVLDQPSFIQAEIVSGNRVIAATASEENGFEGTALRERVQRVQRYSFQRPFIEVYQLSAGHGLWRHDPDAPFEPAALSECAPKPLLSRGVPYPRFDIRPFSARVSAGTFFVGDNHPAWRDRSLTQISDKLKGFPEHELDIVVSEILTRLQTNAVEAMGLAMQEGEEHLLRAGSFQVLDLGVNLSGFPRLTVRCEQPARLILVFDEMLNGLDVNWRRLGCVNAVVFDLEPGVYQVESFEPYTLRYLKIMAVNADVHFGHAGMRLYENPEATRAVFFCSDERLNRIFEAGRTTFAQNAVDIFMDCPHRERAGWLCDSFFIARSEQVLCGRMSVERNFLENFLLPERFEHLPEGMLPMCYPADHNDGVFIPNWAMWFVLQLREYLARTGDRAMIDAFRPRVEALLRYFQGFENEFGLLEKLESWVFIEWSAANNFTQDVNYPSNMLYAAMLEAAADLYPNDRRREQAAAIRRTILQQARNGVFFVDNAVREEGVLKPTVNMTEVCQYFAFYFGVASPESEPELWRILRDEFGPDRQQRGAYPEVHPANAFVGNMLRFELLSREGLTRQLIRETADYLYYMVERTGTLWENIHDHASLNHGFASHIVVSLFRDVLGVQRIDPVNRRVELRLTETGLEYCAGKIPVGDAMITLQWKKAGDGLQVYLDVPEGFDVEKENRTGLPIHTVDNPLF